MSDPFAVVRQFEAALCEYTGAKYAVATTSCTMALLLSLLYMRNRHLLIGSTISIPSRTYVGVVHSIRNALCRPILRAEEWKGTYQLKPMPIWDCARRFTSGMYVPGQMQCVSFHWTKHLAIGSGGAILHDDAEADWWLRRARFDGRTEGKEGFSTQPAFHAYMTPRDAADGLTRLSYLPMHNADLPNSDYPDLSLGNW